MTQTSSDRQQLRRRIEELSQQQAQAEALFASIGQGAIATDKEGRVNRINQAALDILGMKREDIISKWFPEVIVAETADGQVIEPMDRPITKAFLTGQAITQQMFYRHRDGSLLPVTVTVSPVMLNQQPIGAVEVFRDITRDMEIDMMKSEFIYLASHQLRTPLTAVKTYAHLLHDGFSQPLTADQKKLTKVMLSSLDRMNEIISTLLNISRIEAGKLTLVPSKVSLAELVKQSLREIQQIIAGKKIKVVASLRPQAPLQTDALLVKEVWSNLLSNAVKYTPQGGTIKISLSHDHQHQTLRIKDTGYGIPSESQSKLFTKFYRAPNVLDKEEGGTGLGLYLVKGMAEVLGGKVWFDSQQDVGTTFYFQLPIKPPKTEPLT